MTDAPPPHIKNPKTQNHLPCPCWWQTQYYTLNPCIIETPNHWHTKIESKLKKLFQNTQQINPKSKKSKHDHDMHKVNYPNSWNQNAKEEGDWEKDPI